MSEAPGTATALLAFGRALADRVATICGEPVAYGSLAYIGHTGDWSLGLADVDFLVPHAVFPAILAALRADGLSCEETTYRTIKVSRGDAKASFDSLDHYLAGLDLQPTSVVVGGLGFVVVGRAALIVAYRRAAETIPVKREAYLAKLARLAPATG